MSEAALKLSGDTTCPEEVEVILPVPTGWTILIEPIKVKEKSEGGIVLPSEVQKAEEYLRYIGKVVAMGELCYLHEKFKPHPDASPLPWCKVGDYVAHGQHSGQKMSVKKGDKTEEYRLVHDDEILAVVPDPKSILAYT